MAQKALPISSFPLASLGNGRLHLHPVLHSRDERVERTLCRFAPRVRQLPIEQQHLYPALRTLHRVARVVVDEDVRAKGPANSKMQNVSLLSDSLSAFHNSFRAFKHSGSEIE